MASIVSIFFLFISIAVFSESRHHTSRPPHSPSLFPTENSVIQEACKASRDPPTCQSTINQSGHVPPNPTIPDIIQSALGVSSDGITKAESMVTHILSRSSGNLNRTNAAKSCLEVLKYANYRINSTAAALPRDKIKDARAWISAAMVYEYDCWSALKYVNGTSQVNKTMSFLNGLIGSSSDAAAMIVNFDIFGSQTASWGPIKTERDGFWEWADGSVWSTFSGDVLAGLTPSVTVCESECQFTKVQDAVNNAPDYGTGRFVIYIKAGVYQETVRVPLGKTNVVFLGDGMGKTVITGSLNVGQPGMTTLNSATVGVIGDGFMASGLTIQNTAGPDAHQAVAFRSDSDHSVIENCEFLGNQDTLYAHSLRQYYKSCRIQGNVDFIFGNSAAFFQDCIILVAPRQINPENGEKNTITAHGRIDPAQSSGFVFSTCIINGTAEYMSLYYAKPSVHISYLGRPWKEYSRTVFIHCTLEALIAADGWMPWDGDFALKTLYYGEFDNTGSGANISGRVSWSSQIPARHVDSYSVKNFIQGDKWIN